MTSLFLFTVVLAASSANALSWPLCDSVGSTWVSSTPHLSGSFPYYSMLFFCTGNLNLEGSGVDVCINNGKDCGLPAANAFCQYAGFDGAVEDEIKVADATEPVRAVTGEWCLSPGSYSHEAATSVAKLAAQPNSGKPFCSRIDSLVCYRERTTLQKVVSALRSVVAQSPAPAVDDAAAEAAAPSAHPPTPEVHLLRASSMTAQGDAAGRKMLR